METRFEARPEGTFARRGHAASAIVVSEVKVRLLDDPPGSLIGWASCVVNGSLFLNNIEIRRSSEGGIFLAFPNQVSSGNKRHFFFNPISREASQVFEEAIINRLPAGRSA